MAALTLRTMVRPLPGSTLVDDLGQLWRNEMARRERKRLLRGLARRDARLIADMGFDPEEVRRAAEDTWDEFRPELMLRSAPWI